MADNNLHPLFRTERTLDSNKTSPPTTAASQATKGPQLSPYPPLHNSNPDVITQSHYSPPQQGESLSLSNEPSGDAGDPKRSRACEACRGLKVKCEPNPSGEGPCKRCAKANRACQITQPSRKRQKKTDTRVADLEKKIEILQRLTANINPGSGGPQAGSDNHSPSPYTPQSEGAYYTRHENSNPPSHLPSASSGWTAYSNDNAAGAQRNQPPSNESPMRPPQHFRNSIPNDASASAMASKANAARALLDEVDSVWNSDGDRTRPPPQAYSDVIDRGQISREVAEQMFTCYVDKMMLHFPAVIFPLGTSATSVRREKPLLFLAILAAAAGPMFPELQLDLTKELTDVFANRIIVRGEKTLEIIQALIVSTVWYYPPEHFEELKFYQLVHIAAVMAIDIGLGRVSRNQSGKSGPATGYFYGGQRKQPLPDPESLDARRAWLACYFLCCNTSMGLRRPNLIRWTNFMADCLKVLETSSEAVSSDKALCAWIRSQHIGEEVGYQFSMDDPLAKVSIADDKTHYALKKFENDLAIWRQEVPIEARSNSLEMTGHVISLYMHEIAMHVDHNVDDFKPPYHESTIAGLMSDVKSHPLTTSHVEALSACLTAIDGVFDVFLKHSIEVVRCLPVANFVRVAYATVVLIKMSLAASNPESNIGKIFVASNLRAEEHLDGLIRIFEGASADHKSRPSAKFLMVLIMLRTWFQRRLQSNGKPGEVSKQPGSTAVGGGNNENAPPEPQGQQNPRPSQNTQQHPTYAPTNTPLDVLSDVAASSNSRTDTTNMNQYSASSSGWQPPQQGQPQYQATYPVSIMNQQGFTNALNNIDASMSNVVDDDYLMGSGLEQAMGMTLAGFGAYMGDDAFFLNPAYDYSGFST